ncbi:serine hydrolase [Candidatus Poribacteria bacterium]|nr:serine hydrolase [Candidatus Poribacteria bacterium]
MAESGVMSAIQDFTVHTGGVVGVDAKHLETGERVSHNADTVFFTASTLKVPLLVELYRQVDAGIIDVHQRIDLTDTLRVPGSGVLKELASGLQPTVHDLAMLMIIISDNTATDILYNRVGGDNINNTMRQLGLTHTHIPMTCRELLYGITGLEVENPVHTYQLASDRLKKREFVLEGDGFSEDKSDVSSPNDMCRLLELIYDGNILSAQSREAVLDILKRQQLSTVIPHALPAGTAVAHKTGSYHSVRCDVGIVFSPTGPYTVAIMAKEMTTGDRLSVDASLAAISRSVYDEFTE